ncbi:hypothetical protein AURDEDRAFT_164633 [Auricularia subglabra TFB-10046 SS5]|nr:hypothetical protein AURDEDRAFT_164633 [Auricularia subglabra TFB-10046 SS5]
MRLTALFALALCAIGVSAAPAVAQRAPATPGWKRDDAVEVNGTPGWKRGTPGWRRGTPGW